MTRNISENDKRNKRKFTKRSNWELSRVKKRLRRRNKKDLKLKNKQEKKDLISKWRKMKRCNRLTSQSLSKRNKNFRWEQSKWSYSNRRWGKNMLSKWKRKNKNLRNEWRKKMRRLSELWRIKMANQIP